MWGFCSLSAPKKGKSICRLDISPTGTRFKLYKSFHKGHIKGRLSAAEIQTCSLSWQWTQMLSDAPDPKLAPGTSATLISSHLWQEYSLWLSYIVIKQGWPFFPSNSSELFITSNSIRAIRVRVYTHTQTVSVLLSHESSFSHPDFNSAGSHCSRMISKYTHISKSSCCSLSLILFSRGVGGQQYQTKRGIMKSFIVTFL